MIHPLSRSAEFLRELIRCPSVTPEEGGALGFLEKELARMGFDVERVIFRDENTPDVENLYARIGKKAPHVMFAGHTDVVPIGNAQDWSSDAFSAEVKDGVMFGRGAVDMKGGIACFLGAVERYLADHELTGSISFLITGDEEGPSINGTDKLLKWAADKGETWDACIVGEPSNPNAIGDVIKNGRRGSLSGRITVSGTQGHAAYPHLADNPVAGIMDILTSLLETPFDAGTKMFQPSNLEVTSVDVGNSATNVIPSQAVASFNIRFNDTWTEQTLKQEIMNRLERGARRSVIRTGKDTPVRFEVSWIGRTSHVFLTRDDKLINTLSGAIKKITNKEPELSTGGGTSDARFIKDYCPVVEFGLVGQTMHQVDERTPLDDLDQLTAVYKAFLEDYFSQA